MKGLKYEKGILSQPVGTIEMLQVCSNGVLRLSKSKTKRRKKTTIIKIKKNT